jgi:hypothetical protein
MYHSISYHPVSLRQTHTTILSSPLYLGLPVCNFFFCFSDRKSVRNSYKPVLCLRPSHFILRYSVSQNVLLSTRPCSISSNRLLLKRWALSFTLDLLHPEGTPLLGCSLDCYSTYPQLPSMSESLLVQPMWFVRSGMNMNCNQHYCLQLQLSMSNRSKLWWSTWT